MKSVKLALISKNKILIRFFELELISLGYEVRIYADFPSLVESLKLIFVDIDTVNDIVGEPSCPIIRISAIKRDDQNEALLVWPTPIKDIREACWQYIDLQGTTEKTLPQYTAIKTVFVLDDVDHIIKIGDISTKLSYTEFIILELLCSANGNTVTREKIMELIGADDGNISDVYICRLRKKLETPLGKKLIFTERGRGYRTELVLVR